ncbi:MAG: hypothetical protein WA047_11420, partial [Phenylobacterium sp.]|uniref:hypothetical protein n=1 Tax=Phenylobacterium sp. TaxID=1871053 RepID=UPI003BB6C6ED
LRRIDKYARNLVHGRLPSIEVATTSIWHIDAVWGPSTPTGGLNAALVGCFAPCFASRLSASLQPG